MSGFPLGKFPESKILVVDDDADNVAILRRAMSRAGYTSFLGITNPTEALSAFRELKPDIVLLDFRMAPIDGFEVLEQIKPEIATTEFLPIVMLTGHEAPEVKKRALASGATDFVNKDFDPTELLLRIGNLLHTKWLYDQVQRHNEYLEEKVRERTRELEEAQAEILDRLALAAEYRDDATGEHTKRVAKMSADIARALGMPRDYVETIRSASLLHDLGKIGIPDSILHKSNRLTEEEYEAVKDHTVMGGKILSDAKGPLLRMAADIATGHHEMWDGTGYPHGLKGDQIPLSARIVAVADVYDALTDARPYKGAYSREDAIQEIRRGSGTRFDPSVVEAFVKVIMPVQAVVHTNATVPGTTVAS